MDGDWTAIFQSTFAAPVSAVQQRVWREVFGEEYPEGVEQSYVMAELIDDSDRVFPGYEREKCLLRGPLDDIALPLRWEGKDSRELSGRKARVRFFMRASYLYAVTA